MNLPVDPRFQAYVKFSDKAPRKQQRTRGGGRSGQAKGGSDMRPFQHQNKNKKIK